MIIEFVQTKETKVPFIKTGCYSFRKDRGFHFIQRLCCWAMNKIGANYIDEKIELTHHTIDTNDFIDRLFRQEHLTLERRVIIIEKSWRSITHSNKNGMKHILNRKIFRPKGSYL